MPAISNRWVNDIRVSGMRCRIGLSIFAAQFSKFLFELKDPFLEIFAINRDIQRNIDIFGVPPMSLVLRVFSGAERFEPSR